MTKDVEPVPFDRSTSPSDVQHLGPQQRRVHDANRWEGSTYGMRSELERRLFGAEMSWE